MPNETTVPDETAVPDKTAVPDLRRPLAAAYAQVEALTAGVTPDQLGGPTPCAAFDVATLIDHVVFAAGRAAALGRGEVPSIAEETAPPHVELAEAPAELRRCADDAATSWDDAALARPISMPWGETYPGGALVGIYLVELVTHAWDLAFVTGQLDRLDPALGDVALATARQGIKPEYRSEEGSPFGPEVAAPADATVYGRLAAFMGRDPR